MVLEKVIHDANLAIVRAKKKGVKPAAAARVGTDMIYRKRKQVGLGYQISGTISNYINKKEVQIKMAKTFKRILKEHHKKIGKEPFASTVKNLDNEIRKFEKKDPRSVGRGKLASDLTSIAKKGNGDIILKHDIPLNFSRFNQGPSSNNKFSIVVVSGENPHKKRQRGKDRAISHLSGVTNIIDPVKVAKLMRKKTKEVAPKTWGDLKIEIHSPDGYFVFDY